MTIGIRIKLIRKKLNITQISFSKILTISQANISAYEKNKADPSIKILKLISETLNINLNWLLTGEGEMFLELSKEELKKQFLENLKWIDDFGKKILNGEIEITPEIEKKVAFIIETQKMILEKAKKEGYIIEK